MSKGKSEKPPLQDFLPTLPLRGWLESAALAPLGERVDRNRRFLQVKAGRAYARRRGTGDQ